jgi:hypothetical protein
LNAQNDLQQLENSRFIHLIRSNQTRLWLIYRCLRRDDLIKRSSIKLIMSISHSSNNLNCRFYYAKNNNSRAQAAKNRKPRDELISLRGSFKFKQKATN